MPLGLGASVWEWLQGQDHWIWYGFPSHNNRSPEVVSWTLLNSQGRQYGNHYLKSIVYCQPRSPNTLATWCEELTHWKRPWYWERLKAGREGDRWWHGWMASLTQWTWVWVNSGSWDGQGSLVCCSPWGRKKSDMTERLNWLQVPNLESQHLCSFS